MKTLGVFTATLTMLAFGLACAHPKPPAENVVVDAEVRGCSIDSISTLGPTDVAIVIDTSQSTSRPTGADIDGNGVIRSYQRNPALDRGDSRLAAQIRALRTLIQEMDGQDVRFSIITYAGPSTEHTIGRTQLAASRRGSRERVALTSDVARLDEALDQLLDEGSDGKTIFYDGMRRATLSLLSSGRDRRRVVLLLSDSGTPNGLSVGGNFMNVDWRMKNASVKARRHSIVFHTFGLSPDAGSWRQQPIGQIAGATGGTFHPVEDPHLLGCHLARSLRPPSGIVRRERAFASEPVGAPALAESLASSE